MKKIKTTHLMSKLVTIVDPNKKYPVNYIVCGDGSKVFEKTSLLGRDLTENQIFELWESGHLKTK